ncbi:MAG: sulfite reductase (NADPH) flavoprotein alpha-component [Puniceicoccaceae bacterium 5H]|nr:MAG: sulfite reductase (NADPH) flavoprotein alpha-component [Puniceicoccaceae bacterium 5H]
MPTTLPYVPETAPFSIEQRAWLNGFLAGLYSENPADGSAQADAAPQQTLTILYGSQTGNAEGLAKQTRKAAEKAGYQAKSVEMAEYDPQQLADEQTVLIITSTYGEGDPPDNARSFYDFVLAEDAPKLDHLSFAVLALGDSNYADFCQTGKDFDARLEALGAHRIMDRVDCDVDYDEPYEAWLKEVLEQARDESAASDAASSVDDAEEEDDEPQYSKRNPFMAEVVDNRVLNGPGSAKETRHVAFSLEGSGLAYTPGDVLGVYPRNCPDAVAELIEAAGLQPSDPVEGKTLAEVLETERDITRLTLPLVQTLSERCENGSLSELCDDGETFAAYADGRQLIDLFADYQPKFASAEELVQSLKKLQPRLYSISSSPLASPGEVHLTVGRVRYDTHGRGRKGVCSDYLACCEVGSKVGVYLQANAHFKLPENPETPVIMIGPGTGIAPFRAFLHDRQQRGDSGRNWLFFGDQKSAADFLYEEELEGFRSEGVLSRLSLAFSRDTDQKVYVQHRMLDEAEELYRWLEDGAYLYVCGDASRMAKDVDAALHQLVAEQKGVDAEAAAAYVEGLKREKRYLRDVY